MAGPCKNSIHYCRRLGPSGTEFASRLDPRSYGDHRCRQGSCGTAYGQAAHRFDFAFTPKHGCWLNLVEGLFSEMKPSGRGGGLLGTPVAGGRARPSMAVGPRSRRVSKQVPT